MDGRESRSRPFLRLRRVDEKTLYCRELHVDSRINADSCALGDAVAGIEGIVGLERDFTKRREPVANDVHALAVERRMPDDER